MAEKWLTEPAVPQAPEQVPTGRKPRSPGWKRHLTLPQLCGHTYTPVSRHLAVI